MSTLLLVETAKSAISAGTLSTLSAAKKLGPVTALLLAKDDAVAEKLGKLGVKTVLVAPESQSYARQLPEAVAPLVEKIVKDKKFSFVVAPHSSFGKNVLPRVGALLDVAPISDVVAINGDVFTRPIYAGFNVTL